MTTKSKKPTTPKAKKENKTVEVLHSFFDKKARAVIKPGTLYPLDKAKLLPNFWFKF